MAYDLKQEDEVKEYIENLGIEYRFGCYQEKKPEVCHLLGDYLEAIKKDFEKAAKVYKSNCMDYSFGKSCLKIGNYTLVGKGREQPNTAEALPYFERGCELNDPTSCLHAGMILTATGANVKIQRDVPRDVGLVNSFLASPVSGEARKLYHLVAAGLRARQVGIIGGSGLDDPELLEDPVQSAVTTPFGPPSDVITQGRIKGVPCALLARHGRKHSLQPSDVNYRANMWALKEIGCTHVLATTATGSLVEQYQPGHLVVIDDFIDRTWSRKCTFYDNTDGGPRGVCHLPMKPAFCGTARGALLRAAKESGATCHDGGTAVVIQGPRFSSRAESLMHRQWGGHLVNMTTVPEVVLAKELALSYAALALVTDYDCWREQSESVSVAEVLRTFAANARAACDVIVRAVTILAELTDHQYLAELQELVSSSVMLKE